MQDVPHDAHISSSLPLVEMCSIMHKGMVFAHPGRPDAAVNQSFFPFHQRRPKR